MSSTEPWGQFDHYFRASKVKASYQVTVRSSGDGPAESLKRSEARVYAATAGIGSSAPPDETMPLKKAGKGELVLDLARWTPAADSPLLVQFYFEMQFASKGRAPEIDERQFIGVVLAEPEVHSIGMSLGSGRQVVAAGDARPGETVSFVVTAWGAHAFERPGAPTYQGPVASAEKRRFPAGHDTEVDWSRDGALHGAGSTFELTVAEADLGKAIDVTAARTSFALPDGRPATSTLVVPKLEIHGVKGETPASKVLIADRDGHGFVAHLSPAGYPGHLEWKLEGDRLELSDGAESSRPDDRFEDPTVRVLARRPSASAGDQTLVLTFVSAATGKVYEARHRLTAATWPANIRGRVIYERTWNYHDSTTPIAAVKERLPGCTVELWGLPPGETTPLRLSTKGLGEDGAFLFEFVRECTKLSLRIVLEHHSKALVKVQGLSDAHLLAPALEVKEGAVVWGQVDLDVAKVAAGTHDLGDVKITNSTFVELCDLYKSVWFGQRTFSKLAKRGVGQTVVHVPQTGGVSFYSSDEDGLFVLAGDYKDRCVILHEYGHRIDKLVGPKIESPGYEYDDDEADGHQTGSKEHYEAAWQEAFATFMSAALLDDPTYHDSTDQVLFVRLNSDNTLVGPHSEGSCQEALWRLYKTHGAPFADLWKAFTHAARPAHTPYAFYLNWKELRLPKLPELVEAYKKFNMEFHYVYDEGWTLHPDTDLTKQEFSAIADLHAHLGGAGTLAEYCEEFYNRNKYVVKTPLRYDATKRNPWPVRFSRYAAPRRVQVVP